jgi:hypothetical protein
MNAEAILIALHGLACDGEHASAARAPDRDHCAKQ